MTNWILWSIPPEHVRKYFLMLWLVLFLLPGMLLGVRLTVLGMVVNYIWFDLVFYGWVKFKDKLEGE